MAVVGIEVLCFFLSRKKGKSSGECFLSCCLSFDEAFTAIDLTKLRLFDLTGGVTGNGRENDLLGTLVARHSETEIIDLLLGAGHTLLDLNDSGGYLAETLIGQTYNGNVLDLVVRAEEVLDLTG